MMRLRPILALLAVGVVLSSVLVVANESLPTPALPTLQNGREPRPAQSIATDGDPVDLSTGLYVLDHTDFFLPDVIPISFTRTYRPGDPASRPFGIGTMHSYELYLLRDGLCTAMQLILPDGGRVHYNRISGKNCYDASLIHRSTPTPFYESSLGWDKDEQKWVLRFKDGTVYRFTSGGFDRFMYPFMSLAEVQDGSGNILTIARDSSGRVTSMTSPCGLWMRFMYDAGNRIARINDVFGRVTTYEYDVAGRLTNVSHADGDLSRYTYDSAHQMLTIGDESGMIFSNHYDAKGRVTEQTFPDGTRYQFRYVTDDLGKIKLTMVKDRQGHLRIVTFTEAGYTLRDTHDVGRPEERTIMYEWQQGTNQLLQNPKSDTSTSHSGNDTKRDEAAGEKRSSTAKALQQSRPMQRESDSSDERGDLTTSFHTRPLVWCRGTKSLSPVSAEKPLKREEAEKMWGDLIRREQYERIQFLDRRSANPTRHALSGNNTILLEDRREGYVWGLFEGGGWAIEGRLEAELPVEGGIWQLYSKAITRWYPGFANLLQPWHKDRLWEFQLMLRNAVNRREITPLKTVNVSASEILNGTTPGELTAERVPRGQLLYYEGRGVVFIKILGVKKPLAVEVPVVPSFSSFPSLTHEGDTTGSPSSTDLFRSGSRFYIQGKFAKAIGPYQQALDSEKQDPQLDRITWRVLVDNLGIAYGITGDLKRAKETFEHGLSKDPTYSMFHYNLACTYAEMGALDNTMISLKNAYTYRANQNPGEGMPDPQIDPSFRRFMKNDTFLKFLNSLASPRA